MISFFSLSRLQGQMWASACRERLQQNAGMTNKNVNLQKCPKNISKMGVRWVSWSGMCAWCTLEQSTLALVLYPCCARVSTEKPRGTSLERGCAMCAAVPQFSLLWPHGHSWTGQGGGQGGPHPSRQDWGGPGPPHKAHNGQPSVQWLQAGGSSASEEGSGSLWELNQVASGGGGRLEGAGLGRPPLHHGRVLLLPSSGRHPPSPGHPDNTLYLPLWTDYRWSGITAATGLEYKIKKLSRTVSVSHSKRQPCFFMLSRVKFSAPKRKYQSLYSFLVH